MSKIFNVSADCKPALHYMVDIHGRLKEIKVLVDKGEYFTINRARQYGKTTTLRALMRFLSNEYLVVSLDFQKLGDAKFKNESVFAAAFAAIFARALRQQQDALSEKLEKAVTAMENAFQNTGNVLELLELFFYLSDICKASELPVVLMIDEIDSATNNQIFLDFLAQLRAYYIDRENTATFHSVILAGVYDVKNLKRKLRPEDDHKVNSPWNIAADFNVDMNFSAKEIAGMLKEYEADYHTGMNVGLIADMIYDYTSGYPFLVSRICKIVDERLVGNAPFSDYTEAWTRAGILEAVKFLLAEKNTLFESMVHKMQEYPELREIVYKTLFNGCVVSFNILNPMIEIAVMFGFVKNCGGNVAIANRIFETVFYNWFLTSAEVQGNEMSKAALKDRNQFVQNGSLHMELVLEKFVIHFNDLYGEQPDSFKEEDGRRYFLLYLKPIINGTGHYYIEAQTRNMERTDVIVDYNGEQFVIEMKIWRGNAYHQRGEEQLGRYLDYYHLEKGYMLSFNFNKNKQSGLKRIDLGNKVLIEAVV